MVTASPSCGPAVRAVGPQKLDPALHKARTDALLGAQDVVNHPLCYAVAEDSHSSVK
jgi:hypothetical protein